MNINDLAEPMDLLYNVKELDDIETIIFDMKNRQALKYRLSPNYNGPLKLYILDHTYNVTDFAFNKSNKSEMMHFNQIFTEYYPL